MVNKRSFTLLTTLILIVLFSFLSIKIFEIKSVNSVNIINQYRYIQAKNHIQFLEEYIHSLGNLKTIDNINIENSNYNIYAYIKKAKSKYIVDMYVKDLKFDISIHKSLIIK